MTMLLIEELLREAIGLDSEALGGESVGRAAAHCMRRTGIADLGRYYQLLTDDAQALQTLIEEIVVPETWFFRDREPFVVLADHCTRNLGAGRRPLRILSAPCATGEEPYSIAMTLLDAGFQAADFTIDAVDISSRSLAKAERGVYCPNSFRFGSDLIRPRHFHAADDGMQVVESVKTCVTFYRTNLLKDGFARAAYDAIFCRNMLIYLTPEARTRVIESLTRVLAEHGLLFCGHCEVPILKAHGLTPLDAPKAFACRKTAPPEPRRVRPAPAASILQWKAADMTQPPVFFAPLPAESFVPPANTPHPAETLTQIRLLADSGDCKAASELCADALADHGPNADLYCLLAEIRLAENEPEAARDLLQKALYLDPQHYLSLLHMALLCRQNGRAAEADRYRARLNRLEGRAHIKEQQP